jgi:hypothetical protein
MKRKNKTKNPEIFISTDVSTVTQKHKKHEKARQ